MITYVACLLYAAALSYADDAASKRALAELQGTWKLTAVEPKGEEYPLDGLQPRWSIKGNKVLYAGEALATLTLEPATTPKILDLAFAKSKKTYEGIYLVEKDTWKVCVNAETDGVKERPAEFSTKEKPRYRLLVFERDKASANDPLAGVAGFVGIQIRFDMNSNHVVVAETLPDSPAKKAGLKKEDVLLKINGTEAASLVNVVKLIRETKPKSELTLSIARGGKEMDMKVKAGVVPFMFLD